MTIDFTSLLHPRFDVIEAFASGHSSERARAKVSAHLRDCARCQDRVRELREFGARAREESMPAMSADLRARIVATARSGERRIIPAIDETAAVAPSGTRRVYAVLAAAAVVAAIVLVPRRGLDAGPTAGVLSLEQKSSAAAPALDVRYTPSGTLDGADSVILRAETYVARKPGPSIDRRYVLRRTSNGAFAGSVTLPESTTFARYSVASNDGTHVDDNDARGWEMVVMDASSKPLFDGLWLQRVLNGMENWERSSAAGALMRRHHPEKPASLRYTIMDDAQLAGPSRSDSVIARERPVVVALFAKQRALPMDATTMWEWAMLGDVIGDTAITRFWRGRMMREYPSDANTIQQRVFALSERRMPRDERLREFEKLWSETGGQSLQLIADAFELAVKVQDSTVVAHWGDRMMKFGGPYQGMVATQYVTVPAFRARGEVMLRDFLRVLPPIRETDWRTALRTADLHSARRGQWQLQALGKALLDDGNMAAARDTLRRAAALGWDARTLRALGDAELAAGDTTSAAHAFAWVVADARTSRARADSLRARLGDSGRGEQWVAAVASGRELIGALTLKTAVRRPFDADGISYADANGARKPLTAAFTGKLAVVAFVSRHCAPAMGDVASLDSVSAILAKRGVTMLTLVDEAPNAAAGQSLQKYGYKRNFAFDDRNEVSRRMRQQGTPHYFVVEDGKVVRFDARRADELVMMVEALQAKLP